MIKKISLLIFTLLVLLISSCSDHKDKINRIVIGIPADVSSFNPMFTFSVDGGAISELLYLGLVDLRWNFELGELEAFPSLAESWEWAEDSSSITFFLKDDLLWSDSVELTAEDAVFSLVVYSDPTVNSKFLGYFDYLFTDLVGQIDEGKSFVINSSTELKINFKPGAHPTLVDLSFPVIPKHIFDSLQRKELATVDANFSPVTNGPFIMQKWDRNQSITLKANKESFLYDPDNVDELVFKILPDYTSRLNQLKKGEIDFMELISAEDVLDIEEAENLNILTIEGREYDYIAWNNINGDVFREQGKIIPNKLFGNENVRVALTHAINRQEILESFLNNYGSIAVTPVSPIFTSIYNPDLKPYEYNPAKARELLSSEGWNDTNNNGIIDKNGTEFEFTLTIPGGYPLRDFASTIVKNNLKAVGIEMKVESLEMGAFIDQLNIRGMNAWMAAWYIPVPIEINAFWNSNLEAAPLNFVGYQSKAIDEILNQLEEKLPGEKQKELYYKFQKIIHEDNPQTFMYWKSNIVGANKKLHNINISPFGAITHCWEWSVE